MTLTSTSSSSSTTNNPFNLNDIKTKPYYEKDVANPVTKIEGKTPARYEEIQSILQKWSEQLFPSSLNNFHGLTSIINFFPAEENSDLALALNHEIYNVFKDNKPMSDDILKKIQSIFLTSASKKETEEEKEELTKLALQPWMLMKCGESYIQEITKNLNKESPCKFNLESLLEDSLKFELVNESACNAIRSRQFDLFPQKYEHLSNFVKIEGKATLPDLTNLSYFDAFDATVLYLLQSINARHQLEGKPVTETENEIKNALEALKNRYIKLTEANNQNVEQQHLLAKSTDLSKALAIHKAESAKEISSLEEEVSLKKTKVNDANNALYYYPSIKAELQPVADLCKSELENAEQKLVSKKEVIQKTSEDLDKELAVTHARTTEIAALLKTNGIKAESAIDISDKIIEQLTVLADNSAILVSYYEEFIQHAKNAASRVTNETPEVKKSFFNFWG
jgi:hypothetical protein